MIQWKDFEQELDSFLNYAIQEDIGDGDHSSLASIGNEVIDTAILIAKANGIIAGLLVLPHLISKIDNSLQLTVFKNDGDSIIIGDSIFEIKGKAQSILAFERLALNILQRMSGIATQTAVYVAAVKGTNCKILDTRKTTPGFRFFEKLAVTLGGGTNHRFGLYDMIMLKDNHIDFAGGITAAVTKTKAYLIAEKRNLKIEVETRNLHEVKEALNVGGVDRIMLDNFSVESCAEAVKFIDGKCETEASGGITLQTIRAYAETGVDFISVGALTHSYSSLDLSLKAIR